MENPHFIECKASKEHYQAKACVAWCFDARFADEYDTFLKERGFSSCEVDAVKRAGGAKVLAMESGKGKEDCMDQIAASIKLHHTDRVVLMLHMDCGGYGGSQAFNNDHQAEWDHHVAELEKAAALVKKEFPEIKYVETWIADFDGLHETSEEVAEAVVA